ncbi:hypothetical protein HYU23_03370 [Candidatus Woesearchaeota archaeon]|nr:hypothetical protein [Candidatus Woesearchaeota archaeon]
MKKRPFLLLFVLFLVYSFSAFANAPLFEPEASVSDSSQQYKSLDVSYIGNCGLAFHGWDCSLDFKSCLNSKSLEMYICNPGTYCGKYDVNDPIVACLNKKAVGDKCNVDYECLSSICNVTSGTCASNLASIQMKDRNLSLIRELLCLSNNDCKNGFICSNNICVDPFVVLVNSSLSLYNYKNTGQYKLDKNITGSCGSGTNLSCLNDVKLNACVMTDPNGNVANVMSCDTGFYCNKSNLSYSCSQKKTAGVSCANDFECLANKCDKVNRTCAAQSVTPQVIPCNNDGNCPVDQKCDLNLKKCYKPQLLVPQKCNVDLDCGGAQKCDVALKQCIKLPISQIKSCTELGGTICNGICRNNDYIKDARELNCCSGKSTCEGLPQYVPTLGSAIRFDKTCLGNGIAQIKVVYADGGNEVEQENLAKLGVSSSTYTEQDYSCGGLQISPKEGQSVPGYGLMALLLSFVVLIGYYFRKFLI